MLPMLQSANKSKMHLDLGSLILHLIQLQLNIKLHSWILSDLQQLKLAMDDL